MNAYILAILEGTSIVLLLGGFLIRKYRKTILKSGIKTFLTTLACGLASAWVPWTIFGVILGTAPALLASIAIYFWRAKYGFKGRIKTFLTVVGIAVVGSFFVGGIPCVGLGVLGYAWQSILLASILVTLLLVKY